MERLKNKHNKDMAMVKKSMSYWEEKYKTLRDTKAVEVTKSQKVSQFD